MDRIRLCLTVIALCLAISGTAQENKLKKLDKILAKGDTSKATYKLNSWIEKDPEFAPFYWERAMLKLHKGDYQPALVDLNSYTSLGGTEERADYYRGLIQMNQGNLRGALRFLEKHLKSHPDDFKAHQKRGQCLLEMKRYEESLSAYSEALTIRPYHPSALYNTGLSAFYAEHHSLADSLFNRAHNASPLDPDILLAMGLNLNKMRDYEQSAKMLKKLTTLTTENERAWYNLGVNYYFMDRGTEACEAWKRGDELGSLPAKQAYAKYCLSPKGQEK